MITLAAKPPINELHELINTVPAYPISVRQLLKLAGSASAPTEVIEFYESFNPDQLFISHEDLSARTEQVAIMRYEDVNMPDEELSVPEED